MKARLRAPQMLSFSDSSFRIEFPKTMHVDFFNDSSVIESQLDSRQGTYYESQAKVFLKDSVRVFNVTGDTLFANELWWDQRSQEFYTDKPVRVHRPSMIMVGVGLKAPQDFKMFEMYKITNSILRVKDLGEVVSPGDSAAVPTGDSTGTSPVASKLTTSNQSSSQAVSTSASSVNVKKISSNVSPAKVVMTNPTALPVNQPKIRKKKILKPE